MSLDEKIVGALEASMKEFGVQPPAEMKDDLVLLESGLDSMGFAVLVARLHVELGYDPFALMTEPFYPRTLKEFVDLYEKYADHGKS